MPEAQRVKAAQRPKGSALTRRRATTTRFSIVGNPLADLPSGERKEGGGNSTGAVAMKKRLIIGTS
jgi:hypothetical protein